MCVTLIPACPLCLFSGVERTLSLPGSQTSFDLGDVRAGISYTVQVSARVGTREGGASTLMIHRGKLFGRLKGDGDTLVPVPILTLHPCLESPDPETPLTVPGLRVVASDATRIRVAWGSVPGASGFRIIWKTGSGQCGVCGEYGEVRRQCRSQTLISL